VVTNASSGPTMTVESSTFPVKVLPSSKIMVAWLSEFNSATKSCAFNGTKMIVWSTPASKSNEVVEEVSKHAG